MVQDIIRILARRSDLDKTPEYWQSATFQEREAEIVKANGSVPSPNMQFIREVVFHIKESTTMEHLRDLIGLVQERLMIECFQIAINREESRAHLLFDWYDRENQRCRHLTDTHQLKLSTLVVRELEIDDIELKEQFLRYFLMEDFTDYPDGFRKCMDFLHHARPSKLIYRIMRNSLLYAEKKCEGLVK